MTQTETKNTQPKAVKTDPIAAAAKVAAASGAPVDVSEQLPVGPTGARYDGVPQVRRSAEVLPSGVVRETF